MVVWIDVNIIIDVLQQRSPYYHDSAIIWKLCETNQMKGHVSALALANLIYIMRRELSASDIERVITSLSLIFNFTDLTAADIQKAAAMQWRDFGDAIQSSSAERVNSDYIITRNIDDFSESRVTPISPSDFITRFF